MVKRILNILIVVMLAGCSSPRIVSFHNQRLNFGGYDSYRIVHPRIEKEALTPKVEQTRKTIEDRLTFEMNQRGYVRAESPDLDVQYKILLSPKSDTQVNMPNPNTFNYYRYYYDPYFANIRTYNYIEGMVLVELEDNAERRIAWQASVEFRFHPRRDDLNQLVLTAISKLFTDYAYQAGSNTPVKEIE